MNKQCVFIFNQNFGYLLQALEKIRSSSDGDDEEFLTSTDVDELLKDSDDIVDQRPRETIFGYPTRPLYRELGSMLQLWFDSGWDVLTLVAPICTSILYRWFVLVC